VSMRRAIERGKEQRRPYRGAKAFDPACRNHGSCTYCRANRTHRNRRRAPIADAPTWPPPRACPVAAQEARQAIADTDAPLRYPGARQRTHGPCGAL